MARNYRVMREVLSVAYDAGRPLGPMDFPAIDPPTLDGELRRLLDDGLVAGRLEFGRGGACLSCEVEGLTAEGEEFYKLIENDGVWRILCSTLEQAGVDVSYPLLKEVCEEVVKRYVTSFIPEI